MSAQVKRFGTFSGVFVPNVLTIFGVVLFFGMGNLAGNAGLLGSALIITIANLITITTALSMSSITTNIRIQGGGAYFLVSRSLGPEMGGAVGLTLYIAQVFSIAFYIMGFALSLQPFFPGVNILLIKVITLLVLTLISVFSAEIAIKVQYFILAAVLAAIFSYLAGNLEFSYTPPVWGDFSQHSFWTAFALYFPAATGIFAGLSMSGDLRDPHKNIPRGTLRAIGVTYVLYLVIAVTLAFNTGAEELLHNNRVMIDKALVPFLVILGIWSATLSSAIGMVLAAPRTLQALARDQIMPHVLSRGSGPADEPRLALLLSVGLAAGLLFINSLDVIANLLTMFFLSTYGIVNIIAAVEVMISNPAYRPKFRTHWIISLIGGLGSFTAMFFIDHWATVIAIIVILLIYVLIGRSRLKTNWGDIRKGFWANIAEIALQKYGRYQEHPRNWRPHIAILEGHPESRDTLYRLASLMTGKSGMVSYYRFLDRELENEQKVQEQIEELRDSLNAIQQGYVYPEIIYSRQDKMAVRIALQADGIGTFKANTVMADIRLDDRSLDEHLARMAEYDALRKNLVLVKEDQLHRQWDDRIDVWISGFQANISLMLMLPFLITRNSDWAATRVVIHMVVRSDHRKEIAERSLKAFLNQGRISAEIQVVSLGMEDEVQPVSPPEPQPALQSRRGWFGMVQVVRNFLENLEQKRYSETDRQRIRDMIRDRSADARLVILGVHVPETGSIAQVSRSLRAQLRDMPETLLVRGRHNINLFL